MSFTFPNPLETTEFTAPNGITYSWDNEDAKWRVKAYLPPKGPTVDLSPTPPLTPDGPSEGDLWFDTSPDELTLYVYSEASGAWIPAAPPTTLEGRVSENEALQIEIVQRLQANDVLTNFHSNEIVTIKGDLTTIQNDIIELEEEIDAIAPSVERGTWKFNLGGAVASQGQITMYDGMDQSGSPIGLFKSAQAVWLNELDSSGTPHGFANVVEGDLLELFVEGDADYGLFTVVAVHDETAGTNKYWVIDVEFVRSLTAASKADNADNLRVKIIKPPTGGTADGFVLKTGDQMTGELEFYTEQADNTVDYNVPTANTQDTRFTTKRLDTGDTSSTSLFKPGYGDYVVSSGSLMARGSLYTDSFIYGTNFNPDGTRVTKTPRIYFNRSVDSNGTVTSEYGALRWSGNNTVLWDNDKVEVDKPINLTYNALATADEHAIHKGYVDGQIAELLAKIEELEMSGGQPTHYRFTGFDVAYPRSNSQLQQQIGTNELLTSAQPWVPANQQNWKQADIYFYICLPNEWQVNPTGGYIISALEGGKYSRTIDVCNFTFSAVESRALNDTSTTHTVWKVEQIPTDLRGTGTALREFSNQASVIITFYGGSLSKKTS